MLTSAVPPHEIDYSRKNSLLLVCTVLTGVSLLVTIFRTIARRWLLRSFGADDWMMIATLIFLCSYLALIIIGIKYGLGLHIYDFDLDWFVPCLKIIIGLQVCYFLAIYSVKVSILLFYLRLTPARPFRQLVWGTFALITTMLIATLIVVFTQCTPLSDFWDTNIPMQNKKCINDTAFFFCVSVFTIVTDVWILLLSIKLLWRLDRPPFQKIILLAVFLIGTFACVASCIRLCTIQLYTYSEDPSYDSVPINHWSFIEITTAIVCASVPALKIFFSPQRLRERRHSANSMENIPQRSAFPPSPSLSPFTPSTPSLERTPTAPAPAKRRGENCSPSSRYSITRKNTNIPSPSQTQKRASSASFNSTPSNHLTRPDRAYIPQEKRHLPRERLDYLDYSSRAALHRSEASLTKLWRESLTG